MEVVEEEEEEKGRREERSRMRWALPITVLAVEEDELSPSGDNGSTGVKRAVFRECRAW